MNCGASLHPAPVANLPRRKRRGCLALAFVLLALILLCGASYWTTLIRVPIPARADPAPQVVKDTARYANVIQHNLKPPEKIVQLADQLYGADTRQQDLIVVKPGRDPNRQQVAGAPNGGAVDVPPPGYTPPKACAPKLNLTVSKVSQVQPWGGGFAGLWGNGPTLYEFQDESLEDSPYEYYARWVTHKGNGYDTSENTCSLEGWDLLTCTGPDRSTYDTAELSIYSENPDCPAPVAEFTFDGNSDTPAARDKTELCSPAGSFSLANFVPWQDGVARDDILWEFDIHIENYTPEQIDYQYYLVAEGFDSATGEWKTSQNSCYVNIYGKLACWGWNKEKFSSMRYALYQLPDDICTDPVDFGSMGSVTVAGEIEQPVCEFNGPVQLEMVGRSDQNLTSEGEGYNFYATSASDVFDPEDTFYAIYDVRDSNGNLVQQGQRGDCSLNWAVDVRRVGGWYGFSCQGPTASDNQQVSMQLFYSTGGCNQPVTERTWPGQPAFMLAPNPTALTYNRCDAFKSIDIKPQILNWVLGSPVNLYFEIPGGVPGLETETPNDNDPWNYSVQIGTETSDDCQFYPEYKEKLYCSIELPNTYSNTVNPLTLTVNGCDQPLATLTTYLVQDRSGGDGCPTGQTYHPPNSNWPGGCCSNGHWYKWGNDKEPGCWN